MALNELAKTANAALSLSEGLEGKELKKAVIDLVLAMAEEAVKLRRRSLNYKIETQRLKAKYQLLLRASLKISESTMRKIEVKTLQSSKLSIPRASLKL